MIGLAIVNLIGLYFYLRRQSTGTGTSESAVKTVSGLHRV
jgi:hypothetical protein